MLTGRLIRAAGAVAAAPRIPARAFSSAVVAREQQPSTLPSLADIEPDKHDEFNKRQKTFREQLVEAQKAREAGVLSQPQTPRDSSSVSGLPQGLGSLSTAKGLAAETAQREPERKAGPLTSLIYGTKEGRELDAQIEASFSQVLARGKYVHSIVFHEVEPKKVKEYMDLVGKWYPRMASMPENKVHLVGSWRTEVGDCDTFGELSLFPHHIFQKLTVSSSHLGVPAIPRVPCLAAFHLPPSRLSRVRPEAQEPHQVEAHVPDAGVLVLAHDPAPAARRALRAPVVHAPPGQSPRVGDALAARAQGAAGGYGGSGSVVCADW